MAEFLEKQVGSMNEWDQVNAFLLLVIFGSVMIK